MIFEGREWNEMDWSGGWDGFFFKKKKQFINFVFFYFPYKMKL